MSTAPVTAIVRANLVRLLRDRTAAFFLVVLPLLLVFLVGLAFGGGAEPISIAVVGPDTPLADDLVAQLDADPALEVTRQDQPSAVADAVEQGAVLGGLVLPSDYDDRISAGETVQVRLITAAAGGLQAATQGTVDAAIQQADARLVALRAAGTHDLASGLEQLADADQLVAIERRQIGDGADELPRGYDATAGQNLVLFVFITSLVGGVQLIESRRLGVVRRSLAAPVSAATLLVGEAASRYLIALGQGLIVIVGSAVLFGVTWLNLPVTLLLVALFALVGTGAAMVVGSAMSNDEQAESVGIPLGIGLGMLGGCMWPLEIVPDWMQLVGHITPHAWAVDALNDLQGQGAGLAQISTELGVLLVYAAALLIVAALWLRRTLTA